MELLLEVVEGEDAGKRVSLGRLLEIGRDPAVALMLDDDEVSRRHAEIEPRDDGATIRDLGSTNGTYVNDQPIGGPRRLHPGDRVRLGLTVLELRNREQVVRQPSVVAAGPQITQLGGDVLEPVPRDELTPVSAVSAGVPGFLVEESEPAFVAAEVGAAGGDEGSPPGGSEGYGAVAKLIDTRVKRQTNVAAFAILALAGLAVLIFFGAR